MMIIVIEEITRLRWLIVGFQVISRTPSYTNNFGYSFKGISRTFRTRLDLKQNKELFSCLPQDEY
jgi:hypothetical protein